jgi:hypothetical protein
MAAAVWMSRAEKKTLIRNSISEAPSAALALS